MTTLTANPTRTTIRARRARVADEAIISAYIHEITPRQTTAALPTAEVEVEVEVPVRQRVMDTPARAAARALCTESARRWRPAWRRRPAPEPAI